MLLESFKANSDSGYVIIPAMSARIGYLQYDYMDMTPEEVEAWKYAITIPEVRRSHSVTATAYMKVLQGLGIRCAHAGTDACRVLRAEHNATPLCRREK